MRKNEFDKLFPAGIRHETITPFVHKGKWAIHELLPFLLSHTGAADVCIATFNIAEDSLRKMFFLREEEKIRSLTLLLDTTVKRHKLDMLLFSANITPSIHLTNNHMKVLLLENEQWTIGVVGSANLNNNPRYEAGFVFTDKKNYTYFRNAFTDAYENDSIPFEWN